MMALRCGAEEVPGAALVDPDGNCNDDTSCSSLMTFKNAGKLRLFS